MHFLTSTKEPDLIVHGTPKRPQSSKLSGHRTKITSHPSYLFFLIRMFSGSSLSFIPGSCNTPTRIIHLPNCLQFLGPPPILPLPFSLHARSLLRHLRYFTVTFTLNAFINFFFFGDKPLFSFFFRLFLDLSYISRCLRLYCTSKCIFLIKLGSPKRARASISFEGYRASIFKIQTRKSHI